MMELNGKALKDFWVWYLKDEQKKKFKTDGLLRGNPSIKIRFLAMSLSERWGVYQLFWDSMKIDIGIYCDSDGYNIDTYGIAFLSKPYKSRTEARIEAVNQFNKFYN